MLKEERFTSIASHDFEVHPYCRPEKCWVMHSHSEMLDTDKPLIKRVGPSGLVIGLGVVGAWICVCVWVSVWLGGTGCSRVIVQKWFPLMVVCEWCRVYLYLEEGYPRQGRMCRIRGMRCGACLFKQQITAESRTLLATDKSFQYQTLLVCMLSAPRHDAYTNIQSNIHTNIQTLQSTITKLRQTEKQVTRPTLIQLAFR